MEQLTHYHNGEFLKENEIAYSVNDVGLLRGYAVFDFCRVVDGVALFIDDHLDRFEHSAKGFALSIPISRDEIKQVAQKLIGINKLPLGSLKIVLTGGDSVDGFVPGKPNFTILNKPMSHPAPEVFERGSALMLHEFHRTYPDIKSTSYLTALKLQPLWADGGFVDVLYHSGDRVWEVSRSSFFFFDGDTLVTNKEGVLKGITASKVLEICEGQFDITIRDIGLQEVLSAEEVFITSSSKLVMPVVRLGDHVIGSGKPGERTAEIGRLYHQAVKEYVSTHGAIPSQN